MGHLISLKEQIVQQKMYAGAVAIADPTHDIYFVDSVGGVAGYDGINNLHCVSTLVLAYAAASAGDTIILDRTGGETLTASLAFAKAGIRVVCPGAEQNPESGYTLTLADDEDVVSVTGTDVLVDGIRTVHTGDSCTAAGIKVGAAAHRATILNCIFDDSAIVTTFTGFGVEVVGGAEDVLIHNCRGRDLLYGVNFVANSTENTLRPTITDCKFFVGQANAFGIGASPGTGAVWGLHVDNCKFFERDGDGSAATAAWDGSNGTTAAQGPIEFGANCDGYIVEHCEAFTALNYSFDLICAINGGAVGEMIENVTDTGDLTTAVTSVGTAVSTCTSTVTAAHSTTVSHVTSVGTEVSTAESHVTSVGTAVSTAQSHVTSVGTEVSSAISHVGSVGTAVSTAQSQATSEAGSVGTAVSTAQSHVTSVGTEVSTAISHVGSVGTAVSTCTSTVTEAHSTTDAAISTAQSHVTSVGTEVSTAISTITDAHSTTDTAVDSVGTEVSTAISHVTSVGTEVSTAISHVESVGTAVSTAISTVTDAHSTTDTAVDSVGTEVSTAISHVTSVGTEVSTAISAVDSVGTLVAGVSTHDAAAVVTALFAKDGWSGDGSLTFEMALLIMSSMLAGNYEVDGDDILVFDLGDPLVLIATITRADDGRTVVIA